MPARIAAVLLVSAFLCASVHADSWELPQQRAYKSANGRFEFRVVPKQIESQLRYLQDKAERKANAGALAGVIDNVCRGTLYERKNGKLVELWSIPLVNEVAPVSALVTNDGSYVVTFDNWHSVGYGDDVVVIYDSEGRLWRKYALEELLPESYLTQLPTSTSSRTWGEGHQVDDENGLLILQIANFARPDEIIDSGRTSRGFSSMKISLDTGRVVQWHPRPWKEYQVASGRELGIPGGVPGGLPGGPTLVRIDWESCARERVFERNKTVLDVGSVLADRTVSSVNPPYPPMAKAAGVTGRVTVQVLISDFGDVLCSRAVAGHPLLRRAAESAASEWRFEPAENGNTPVWTLGTIAFDFRLVEVLPDGAVE
jgi:TonB family protein